MQTKLQGNPVNLSGDLPTIGSQLPDFKLVTNDLKELSLAEYTDETLILNIFPSVDTGTCAMSVRRFNQEASNLSNSTILCISCDLPFAQARFCGAESLDKVVTLSAFRSTFGRDYGVEMADGPLAGLLARAIVIADGERKVIHSQLVGEITQEPDYESALSALK